MKKTISALLIFIALLPFLFFTISAHPGRTDSAGGHYNRSTGEYHYHHGYPAHSHYDMDGDGDTDCKYYSGIGGNAANKSPSEDKASNSLFDKHFQNKQNENNNQQPENNTSFAAPLLIIGVVCVLVISLTQGAKS